MVGFAVGGTHDVRGGGAVVAAVRGAPLAVRVGRPRWLPLVDHQVDGHLALEAADVPVTEVVTQLVDLRREDVGIAPGVTTPIDWEADATEVVTDDVGIAAEVVTPWRWSDGGNFEESKPVEVETPNHASMNLWRIETVGSVR